MSETTLTPATQAPRLAEPRRGSAAYLTLDAWRGVASLWVVTFHAAGVLTAGTQDKPAYFWPFTFGFLGVQMFYVISGYCIATSALSCSRRPAAVRSFAVARARRIFPAYWASFLAFFAAALLAEWLMARGTIKSSYLADFKVSSQSPGFYFANLSLTAPFFGVPLLSVVAWTLCYEISFYALVGIALACLRRHAGTLLAVLHGLTIACCVFLLAAPTKGFFPLDMWPQFGLGIMIYDFYASTDRRRAVVALAVTLSLMGAYALACDSPWAWRSSLATWRCRR